MIDIHSHILPGIDDGSPNIDESLAMARVAVDGGTTVMIATPHITCVRDLALAHEIAERTQALQSAIDEAGIPLRLLPGAEVYPLEQMHTYIEEGYPITLAQRGKAVLLDPPFTSIPMGLGNLLFQLQSRGINVIMAHPERVGPIQQNPQLLEDHVMRGLLLQVNAGSVLGAHGEAAARVARLLLRHQWVQFIASDAHSATNRAPGLSRAHQAVADIVGTEMADTLCKVNPRLVIEGESVHSTPLPYTPERKRKKGFLSWFSKR